jgi:lipoprotein-releasing system ATP-binding protein
MPQPLLIARNLHKAYRKRHLEVPVLKGLDLEVERGEFLSLVGASGCGKTTLLHLLGTLDRPDKGEILLEGRRIDTLTGGERDRLRNEIFGFIFQFYHLLPELNVLENILMPEMIRSSVFSWWGKRRRLRREALRLIDLVGLGHRVKHKPSELSGGEMQRTAIARALMNQPQILLADEPTGNLDSTTGEGIVQLLHDLNRQEGLTIVMVTHNAELAASADRIVRMAEGRIAGENHVAVPAEL